MRPAPQLRALFTAVAVTGLTLTLTVPAATPAAAAHGARPCVVPLTPTTVLDTASSSPLVSGQSRTLTLPAAVPADALAVVFQLRAKASKAGDIRLSAAGVSSRISAIRASGQWASATAVLPRPTQQVSVVFEGPSRSTASSTAAVVGYVPAQECFNPLSTAPAIDSTTGKGLPAASPLQPGTTTPLSLQSAEFLPADAGLSLASIRVGAGSSAAKVILQDSASPPATVASWSLLANEVAVGLEILPPSQTSQYTVTVQGGSASFAVTPVGWFTNSNAFAPAQSVVLDTANGVGFGSRQLTAGQTVRLPVPSDMPSAAALSLLIEGTPPKQDTSIFVWPADEVRPTTVSVHLPKGRATRQQLVVAPGNSREVTVSVAAGSSPLKVTVAGWVPVPPEVNQPVEGVTHLPDPAQVSQVQQDPASGDVQLAYAGSDKIDVGDVLVLEDTAEQPDGYLGVVTDVEPPPLGPTVSATATPGETLTLRQGSLLDALPIADLDSAILAVDSGEPPVDDSPPLPPDEPPTPEVATFSSEPTDTGSGMTTAASSPTSGSLSPRHTFCSTGAGWLVTTSLKLEGGLNLTGQWRPGTPTTLDFNFDGGVRGSVSLNAAAGTTCTASGLFPGPALPTIKFFVGPVPVIVRPELSMKMGVEGSVGGALKSTAGVDVGLKTGVHYVVNGAVTPYFTPRANFPVTVDARLGANARVTVVPRLVLKVYGVAGPFVEIGATARGDVNILAPAGTPWWTAEAGVTGNVGLALDVWFVRARFDAGTRQLLGPWRAGAATAPYPGPTITTTALPNGTVGSAYGATLQSSGGATPTSWHKVSGSLPAGLSLNTNGTISGTPTSTQTSSFLVRAISATGYRSAMDRTLSISVGTGPSVTTTSLPDGTVGAGYSAQLQAAGGTAPYSWAVVSGALPAGLSVSSSGLIAGTPTVAQTASFVVRALDAAGRTSNNASLTLTIQPTATQPPPPPPPTASPKVSLARGGTAPAGYWYSVSLSGFSPGSSVTLTCKDSVDPGGFWNQSFTIDGNGNAGDSTLCYSADGPDHWVTGGGVESNHVTW